MPSCRSFGNASRLAPLPRRQVRQNGGLSAAGPRMPVLHDIDPAALHLPVWPNQIHWYGVMYLLAFAVFWWLGSRRIAAGRLPGVDDKAFGDFLADPLFLLRINEGGMSFHGGLLGVMVAVAYFSWKHRLHVFDTMDFDSTQVPQALGFGRLGNYIGGELWGRPTEAEWGVIFPRSDLGPYTDLPIEKLRELHAAGLLDPFARHPSQLYQAALEGLAMFAILYWYSRKPRPRYAVSGWFAILYGVFRIAAEFVREPDAQLGYQLGTDWITRGMLLSLPLIAVGVGLLALSRRAPTLQPAPVVAPAAEAAR